MILSAGLTPAWQQIMLFRNFRYGEVNRAAEVHWLAQGKVLNVGIGVHHLGGPNLTLATLGGPPMEQIDREFATLGVPHRWIVTQSPTRVCTTILDEATHTITELVENGKPLQTVELDAFRQAYAEEAAKAGISVVTGSLPIGTPPSFYRELVEKTPCPVILDFRGEGLLGVLDLNPLIVKPNREELAQTIGSPIHDDRQLLDAMRLLNHRGARWTVVTQGAGPVWITSLSKTYRIDVPPAAKIVNPIGSGDALTAGIAWAIRAGRDIVDAVRLGIATAAQHLDRIDSSRHNLALAEQQANRLTVEEIANA
jgi:1-phosphofructokinase family hexose kinase